MNANTQSIITLIINGEQAKTSFKEVTQAVNASRAALLKMKEANDPEAIKKATAEYNKLVEVQKAMKKELLGGSEAAKGFFSDFLKGFSELEEMAGKITAGTLIYKSINFAIEGFKDLFNGSVEAYDEAQRTQTQLQTVIKTTGQVAGQTREKLEGYQAALMDQTGIDDDVIAKGEEMLLTFTNIRGQMFEKLLPTILDVTAAMNGGKVTMEGVQKTSIQLGKAFQDPINGAAALKKMGVTLDDQQKSAIKTMQDSNNLVGAQGVLLKELQKEFGGTAKAVADTDVGAMQKFETRIGNIKESIGQLITQGKTLMVAFLGPFVSLLEKFLGTPVAEKLQRENSELNNLVGAIQATNDNQTVRNQLIAELQAKYPDFLGNIKKEDAANELLQRRLKAVNDEYRQKIFLAVNDDKIKDIEERRKQAIDEQIGAIKRLVAISGKSSDELSKMSEVDLQNLAGKYAKMVQDVQNRSTNDAGSARGSIAETDFNILLNGKKTLAALDKEENELTSQNAKIQDQLTKEKIANIDKEIAAMEKKKAAEKDAGKRANDQAEIDRLIIERKGLLGIVDKPTSGPSAADKKQIEDKKKKAQELYDSLIEQARAFRAKELAEQKSANDKELALAGERFDEQINKQKEALRKLNENKESTPEQKKGIKDTITQIGKDKDIALDAVRIRQEKDLTDKISKFYQALTVVKANEYDKQKQKTNEYYDGLIEKITMGTDYDELAQDKKETIDKYEAARQSALRQTDLTEAEQFQQEKIKLEAELATTVGNKDDIERATINKEYDAKLADLKAHHSATLQETIEFKKLMEDIEAGRARKLDGVGKKTLTPEEKRDMEVKLAQDTANALVDIHASNVKAETDEKIKSLEDQKTKELSNKNLTEAQKKAINDKYDKLEAAQKLKAWEADRDAKAETILINGAVAISKTFAEYGFTPAGWFAAGIAAGEMTLQEAAVLSAKAPKFRTGTYMPKGPSHEDGGINLVNNKTGQVIGEMEGDEPMIIMPKNTSTEHLDKVRDMAFNSTFRNPAQVSVSTMSNGIAMARSGAYYHPQNSNSTIQPADPGQVQSSTNNDALMQQLLVEHQLTRKAMENLKIDFNTRVYDDYRSQLNYISDRAAT